VHTWLAQNISSNLKFGFHFDVKFLFEDTELLILNLMLFVVLTVMHVLCNIYAVNLCGQLKPEMQLLPTAILHVLLIESELYVEFFIYHINGK